MYKPFIPVKDLRAAYYMEDFLGSTYNGMNWLIRSLGTPTVAMTGNNSGGAISIGISNVTDSVEIYQPFQVLNVSKNIYFSCRVKALNLTYCNFFAGIVAGTPNNEINKIGLYFQDDSGISTNWFMLSKSVGSSTSTDSGIVATSDWTELKFSASSDAISYWINNNYVGTITTNIPITNLGSSVKVVLLASVSWSANIDYIEVYSDRI